MVTWIFYFRRAIAVVYMELAFFFLNKRHPMPGFKLIKPHGHERDKVDMLQAAYNQEHKAK
jgi:hypothetical protein